MSEFVATSVARRLISRFEATHEKRRISVFSGPPGIGKTTAIDAFRSRRPDEIAVVKIARRNAREVLVLQHVLDSLRKLSGSAFSHAPSSIWDLRNDLFGALCTWCGADASAARRDEYQAQAFPRLTIVFDEAQNLSREAIEALRYWNDADRCYAPFQLGLVFVGNNEFSLSGSATESVISAAVADRALFLQTFDYDDIVDDDLHLFIEATAEIEEAATAVLVRSFKGPRSIRSLRRLTDILDELVRLSPNRPIMVNDVREALQLA